MQQASLQAVTWHKIIKTFHVCRCTRHHLQVVLLLLLCASLTRATHPPVAAGALGHFRPSQGITQASLEAKGLWDIDRLCQPHVTDELLHAELGDDAEEVLGKYLERCVRSCAFRSVCLSVCLFAACWHEA